MWQDLKEYFFNSQNGDISLDKHLNVHFHEDENGKVEEQRELKQGTCASIQSTQFMKGQGAILQTQQKCT
jgi:hypothetical protein